MLLNDLVDLPHQADSLLECNDNLLVVSDVVLGESAALAILEPFLANLVAADAEVPHDLRHAMEADGSGNGGPALLPRTGVKPDSVVRPTDPSNRGVLRPGIGGDEVVELGGLVAWAERLKAMPGFALPYDLIPSKDLGRDYAKLALELVEWVDGRLSAAPAG